MLLKTQRPHKCTVPSGDLNRNSLQLHISSDKDRNTVRWLNQAMSIGDLAVIVNILNHLLSMGIENCHHNIMEKALKWQVMVMYY